MAWSTRGRWVAYGIAALATVAAMRWVDEAAVIDEPVAAVAAPRPASRTGAGRSPAGEAQVRLDWLARAPMGEVKGDPFGPGPTEPPPPATLREAPPAPPPKPQAPPLPFAYLGKWIEDGRTIVFLSRGGQNVAVRGVGKLDATYSVESIDERQMVLKYLPLGTRQTLAMAPPAGGGAQPAAQVAAARAESSSQETEEGTN